MKKILALVLALALLLSAVPAMASVDLSHARNNSSVYKITMNDAGTSAFVDTSAMFSVKQLSFTHKYESDYRYSVFYFDMIVINYFENSAYPVLRMWIEYEGKNAIYANSFSLIFNGKKYTFSGASETKSFTPNDKGEYSEVLLVAFNRDNLQFLADLESYYNQLTDGEEEWIDALEAKTDVTLILHGIEDVEVKLDYFHMLNFMLMRTVFLEAGGLNYLTNVNNDTTLKITNLQ